MALREERNHLAATQGAAKLALERSEGQRPYGTDFSLAQ